LETRISPPSLKFSTLVNLLRWRTAQQPEQRIYTFLTDGETKKDALTFAELDQQARKIGASLQERIPRGGRALLIYPSGLDFIAAFFGCLYSGIVAVPVYPPSTVRSDRTLTKFRAIVQNVEPHVVLTSTTLSSKVTGLLEQTPELQGAPVIVTDTLPSELAEQWTMPDVESETLAFLQYTSGSTGVPKGVMITHGNLLHNMSLVERYCQHPDTAHGVMWLPLYHDLGLIGGVLQPLYAGYESTIMAPTTFLQRPYRWLQAMSRTQATITGAPNFAYDLCVQKITAEQKKTLDLSHWEIVANGAEPVRKETMERFSAAFASTGFRRNYFYPCYGLAEATLVVSAGTKGVFPTYKSFRGDALQKNLALEADEQEVDAITLVSSGKSHADQTVLVVNPETQTVCPADRVGEVWISGPSVAQGYWQRPVESAETFQAHLSDGSGPFLRTGDLGFMDHDELFLTGRLKDLIIIRGGNHYPQDIEKTVEASHAALRLNGGAAFSIEVDGEERLVVVNEIERTAISSHEDLGQIIAAIRQAIAQQHEIQIYAINLIKPASLPKTSSGKVQRGGTKASFLEGTLDSVRAWKLDDEDDDDREDAKATTEPLSSVAATTELPHTPQPESMPLPSTPNLATLRSWLIEHVATALKVKPNAINVSTPFAYYGMDSAQAVSLSADLEDLLQRPLAPTLAYDYPNIEALARYLTHQEQIAEQHGEDLEQRKFDEDAIAIIGMGCRFPGANNPDEFWRLLHDGVDGISEVPADRWSNQTYYDQNAATPGKMNTRWGGFLTNIDKFDPKFFGISPREADGMDPQQRLLLEVAWETLEHAGLAPEKLVGSQTGVFVGISSDDYSRLQYKDARELDAYAGTGNAHSIAANRISYVLDLRGPSMAMDTACSSSLLAIHQACQSIRNHECTAALAGGVNLVLTPELTITFSQARMMSSVGQCHAFDDSADGYVRGEGCGLVMLKAVSEAQRDGDTILAVIRGSAVNQDGRSNGLTAPNGPAQEAVIRQALKNARVQPQQISYVETHGSSTPLGDPIEVAALKNVLMQERTAEQPCLLGAVKTNIGHLESAAGIAGLIKTVLSLQKGEIVPNLHFERLNTRISFEGTTFAIPTQPLPWPTEERIAGVSAFGFGGTNVHVILEAGPAIQPIKNEFERTHQILTLSAMSEEALVQIAKNYQDYLKEYPTTPIADLAFTANTGREHFASRLAITTTTTDRLRGQLATFIQGKPAPTMQHGRKQLTTAHKIAFLFTGQGSQYINMARQLYDTQPTFKRILDHCDQILQEYLEQPLLSILYPALENTSLDETAYTQPALFALEYALAELWKSWGITPEIVMGHSVGEYVAACVAGMFSLEDGLKLISARGRLMQALPQPGAMVVVFAEPDALKPFIEPVKQCVSIAAINGPKNTVLSGDPTELQTIVQQLEAAGITTHPMAVSHAFHSPLMVPMLDAFEQVAHEITFAPLRLPLVSNVSGQILTIGETVDAHYWRTQTHNAVQFEASISTLAEQGYNTFIEIGPSATLINMGKRCIPEISVQWLSSLQKDHSNWQTLLESVGKLYSLGLDINWSAFERDYRRNRLSLPTYPFERQTCWFEHRDNQTSQTAIKKETRIQEPGHGAKIIGRHPLLDTYTALAHPANTHIWESTLDTQDLPYLRDHRIQGAVALPMSVYIEMAQAASREALGTGKYSLKEIELKKLLLLPEKGFQKVQVVLSSDTSNQTIFFIYSHAVGAPDQPRNLWTLYATGKIQTS
jgi:acyl transferase domain-containing protein/acyl-CoA synthetase (AMP-forming)/AMP-acid ligase II/acyl carrier protein